MKHSKIKKRLALFLITLVASVTVSFAQAPTVKHIVERGETIETIAKKYGVTKEEIVNLNPDAAQFVYTGMELTIPVKTATESVREVNTSSSAEKGSSNRAVAKKTSSNNNGVTNLGLDEIFLDVNYRATFSDAGKGSYMVEGFFYKENNFGLNAGIGANYGIIDSEYAGIQFIVGPSYRYVVDDRWRALVSLDYYGNFHKVPVIKSVEEYIPQTENKMKLGWGVSLSPRILGTFDQIGVAAGLDFQWLEADSKVYVGFSVGMAIKL